MSRAIRILAGAMVLAAAAASQGILFKYSDSFGRAATADFSLAGSELTITLTNTSTMAVVDPAFVLTALFFNAGGTGFVPIDVSGVALANIINQEKASTWGQDGTQFKSILDAYHLRGEYGYKSGIAYTANSVLHEFGYGLSSAGFGTSAVPMFGPNNLFDGSGDADLDDPLSPDGLNFGLVSASTLTGTGNGDVKGNPLINNSVSFTLGVNDGFTLNSINNVWFQYGTSLDGPGGTGNPPDSVPEPFTMGLLAAGLGIAALTRRRRA